MYRFRLGAKDAGIKMRLIHPEFNATGFITLPYYKIYLMLMKGDKSVGHSAQSLEAMIKYYLGVKIQFLSVVAIMVSIFDVNSL